MTREPKSLILVGFGRFGDRSILDSLVTQRVNHYFYGAPIEVVIVCIVL